jgi:hypothetical protein
MKKMKNIAVVLRGQVRTWHFNAPKVFDFYDKIADNVDYYFITWDTSNTEGIEESFKNQNLIHFHILSYSLNNSLRTESYKEGEYYNGHLGPPFMNMIMLPHIRRQEKRLGTKYDCIFDTRPDVLPVRNKIIWGEDAGNDLSVTYPDRNTIYFSGLEMHTNLNSNELDVAMQDWFMYMGSDEFEIFNMRYHTDNCVHQHDKGPGTQIEIREYVVSNPVAPMTVCVQDWCNAYMLRPNVFRLDWLDRRDTETVLYKSRAWPTMTKEDKITDCERYGISLSDYVDTPSITCKI